MLSEKIAYYVANLTFETLPEAVVEFTKMCVLDYYSSLIKGQDASPVQMMSEMIAELGGAQQASTITGLKTSVANAAFVNAGASHVIELDDIHKASIVHAATVIMPTAFAIAEWKKVSGKELITAIVAGYEIAFRVGEAVSPSHYYYFHNTATCGTFGSTVAAAKLLGLSREQIVHALGSAGTQAAGLWEFIEDGAMSKQLHPGKAAMNGILSCLLAQRGFTGASQILDGRRGFFDAMSEQYDASKITDGLGEQFKIIENSFKVHASCRHTHAVMDLCAAYWQQHTDQIEQITAVTIRTYKVALDITDNPNPQTIYGAKFSMQFCAALALYSGSGSYEAFNETNLHKEEVRQLMKKIKVAVDRDMDAQYPEKWGAIIDISWQDGHTDTLQSDYPVGDPENPVTLDALITKFNSLADYFDEKQREEIVQGIVNLEQQDVTALTKLIYR